MNFNAPYEFQIVYPPENIQTVQKNGMNEKFCIRTKFEFEKETKAEIKIQFNNMKMRQGFERVVIWFYNDSYIPPAEHVFSGFQIY